MFFVRGHFGKSVFPQDAYLYIRHLTFLNIPFIMRYKYVCNYTYIQAWKGTSNSPRYRTESSRQMRGARETHCEYIPEPRIEQNLCGFQ